MAILSEKRERWGTSRLKAGGKKNRSWRYFLRKLVILRTADIGQMMWGVNSENHVVSAGIFPGWLYPKQGQAP